MSYLILYNSELFSGRFMHYAENIKGPFDSEKSEYSAIMNYTRHFEPSLESTMSLALSMRYYSPKVDFYRHLSQVSLVNAIWSACGEIHDSKDGCTSFVEKAISSWWVFLSC